MDGTSREDDEKYLQPIKQNTTLRASDDYMVNHINLDPTAFLTSNRFQISNSNNVDVRGLERLITDNKLIEDSSLGVTSITTPITASTPTTTNPAVNVSATVTVARTTAASTITATTATASKFASQPAAPVVAGSGGSRSSTSGSRVRSGTGRQVLASTDCQELIVFCIDISSEMNRRRYKAKAGASFSAIELVKRALRLFVYNKNGVIPTKHQFALVLLLDQALWLSDFTYSLVELTAHLEELHALQAPADQFDMSTLFDVLLEKAKPPVIEGGENMTPPYTVRAILIYGRSHCMPVIKSPVSQNILMGSPCFFLDILYLNEPPADSNLAESIFSELCDLDDRGTSYVFDVSKMPTKVFDAFAKLLAHPLQRVPQIQFGFKLEPVLLYEEADIEAYG